VPGGHDFVFVDAPESKARAEHALPREQKEARGPRERVPSGDDAGLNGTAASGLYGSQAGVVETLATPEGHAHSANPFGEPDTNRGSNGRSGGGRVKTLPTPPVGPVLPDFNDLMPVRADDGGVKRKTSVVKKLRERIK